MSRLRNGLLIALLCISCAGPSVFLPHLSAHRPTVSAPAPLEHRTPGLPDALLFSPLLGLGIDVPNPAEIAAKWKARAGAAAPDYGKGVAGAGGKFEAGALAAEDNWAASTTEAIGRKSYGKGVRGSGAKYQKRASEVGPQRYQGGVNASENDMAQGMAGVVQTLQGINLPPRGVKGTNGARSDMVAQRLRAWKLQKA